MMTSRGRDGARVKLLFRSGASSLSLLGLIGMFQIDAAALPLAAPAIEASGPRSSGPELAKRATRPRCADCGVIAGVRDLGVEGETKRPGVYEFTLRLADGSTRVVTDANPAAWRLGERASIIDGIQ